MYKDSGDEVEEIGGENMEEEDGRTRRFKMSWTVARGLEVEVLAFLLSAIFSRAMFEFKACQTHECLAHFSI